MMKLSDTQREVVFAPTSSKIFLEGAAGTGKTTTAIQRIQHLLSEGVPGNEVFILVPQRNLAFSYQDVLAQPGAPAGTSVEITTLGGLARRWVDWFFPLIAETAGFAAPDAPPVFLSLETAQYHMANIVRPLMEQGFFEGLVLDPNRLFSQILDNLNKAAFVGFPHAEIGDRLSAAMIDSDMKHRIYQDVQVCAARFRAYCLANNLLDYSLTLELFRDQLWSNPKIKQLLMSQYRHLILENVEEDTPVCHDIFSEWLDGCDSALVIYDHEAGYRRFLGADPESALRLASKCDQQFVLQESFVMLTTMESLLAYTRWAFNRVPKPDLALEVGEVLHFDSTHFFPEMLDWATTEIKNLVDNGVPPGEIVVISPYLSDALRFSLMHRLEMAGIPVQSHRPSRALREEPASQSLVTFAMMAHPGWRKSIPKASDVAYALVRAIDGLDLVRSQLLVDQAYRVQDGEPVLAPFETIHADTRSRVSYAIGERYETLRRWLHTYRESIPDTLDVFFSRLFGEVLSQPGYRFHANLDDARVVTTLITSAREFRWAISQPVHEELVEKADGGNEVHDQDLGKIYLDTLQQGVIAAQYLHGWTSQHEDAVLLVPASTFLMSNRAIDYQFWLNPSSRGWFERLNQPLTHPYVLSRQWSDRVWTDQDEVTTNEDSLYRILSGLMRRCRKKIYLGLTELDEQGFDHKGPLMNILHRIMVGASSANARSRKAGRP